LPLKTRGADPSSRSEILQHPPHIRLGLVFVDRQSAHISCSGHTGAEKVYHSLDPAAEAARNIGFETIRVEERFGRSRGFGAAYRRA
jgi:hypothetical protein